MDWLSDGLKWKRTGLRCGCWCWCWYTGYTGTRGTRAHGVLGRIRIRMDGWWCPSFGLWRKTKGCCYVCHSFFFSLSLSLILVIFSDFSHLLPIFFPSSSLHFLICTFSSRAESCTSTTHVILPFILLLQSYLYSFMSCIVYLSLLSNLRYHVDEDENEENDEVYERC